jgi:hypothetical protein
MVLDTSFDRGFAYEGLEPPLSYQADDLIMNRFNATL